MKVSRHARKQTCSQADMQASRYAGKQICRQADMQASRHAGTQTQVHLQYMNSHTRQKYICIIIQYIYKYRTYTECRQT
jgi:hypothetical protein